MCAENSDDNSGIYLILQCLHRVKAFFAPYSTPPVRRLGVHKELGGDSAKTAEPN